MNIDLSNFDIPSIESWKAQVQRETNKDKSILYENKIEKIQVDLSSKGSNYDFQSNTGVLEDNNWDIAISFVVDGSFKDNKYILKCLNQGANHIYLRICESNPNWNKVFENILMDYVHVSISFESELQVNSFRQYLTKEKEKNFTVSIDLFSFTFLDSFKDTEVSFSLNAFDMEQIGASTFQQLASLLFAGEKMLQLINPERIKFEIGIGSEFFVELSKIRAFKWLWNHLMSENDTLCSQVHILARSGWSNKSLNDSHTNLLRQTTEGLSAVCAGVSSLLLHPTSELSKEPLSWFDQRMALNISHILKEESFIAKVNDPLRGSHVIELVTKEIILNSWTLFLKLMENASENNDAIIKEITHTRDQKTNEFLNGQKELLGINLFRINKDDLKWQNIPVYMDMEYLIFEKLNDQ